MPLLKFSYREITKVGKIVRRVHYFITKGRKLLQHYHATSQNFYINPRESEHVSAKVTIFALYHQNIIQYDTI